MTDIFQTKFNIIKLIFTYIYNYENDWGKFEAYFHTLNDIIYL